MVTACARLGAMQVVGLGHVRRLRKTGLVLAECLPYSNQTHLEHPKRWVRQSYAWQRDAVKGAVKKVRKLLQRELRKPGFVLSEKVRAFLISGKH